jgi:hypothetical protein
MPNYVVRPSSSATVVTAGGGTNPTSSTTVRNNLGDNSDTTFVTRTSNNPTTWRFALTAPTIPTDEFICRIGHSIRWKGGGNNASIGVNTYRSADPVPTFYPSLTTDGRATITSTEVGVTTVNWLRTDASALRIAWFDGTNNFTSFNTTTYDIWSTVYTIKRSTAVPVATTMTASAFPAVPVNVTNTIDWEASTQDFQNLRKINVELRVEASSSTSAESTPALSIGKFNYNALVTGTDQVTVAGATAIPNGTYKMYARATRNREGLAQIDADQIGAWSSAITLTMNAALPNTPTVTTSVDTTQDKVTINVTPIATTGYTVPLIDVERSDDGGTTWTEVRDGTDIAGTFGSASTFFDYEAPRAITVKYRARVSASFSGAVNTGLWSTPVNVVITPSLWHLKVPQTPALNAYDVRVVVNPSEDITEDLGVFRPLDRRYPVVVSGKLGGWDGEFTIATITAAEWDTIKALIEAQRVLLLQSPYGWDKYIRIVNGARTLIQGTTTTPRRRVTFQYVEVGSPN